jgi:hypothetical protein
LHIGKAVDACDRTQIDDVAAAGARAKIGNDVGTETIDEYVADGTVERCAADKGIGTGPRDKYVGVGCPKWVRSVKRVVARPADD